MLTYRQLLLKCDRKVLCNILARKTRDDLSYNKELKGEELEARIDSTVDAYVRVIETMVNKEGNWPTHAIILDLVREESFDEKTFKPNGEFIYYISTNYYNSTAAEFPANPTNDDHNNNKYHKFMGFGLSPWADFVNSDVVISPEVASFFGPGSGTFLEKVAAEILWEQTWYGFTEAENQDFSNMLNQRVEDIKSGKIKTKKIKKKKGDKYTVHIPEDLLTPVKKKK